MKEISQLTEFLGSGLKFDAVIDNNSKDVEQASAITDAVKVGQYSVPSHLVRLQRPDCRFRELDTLVMLMICF